MNEREAKVYDLIVKRFFATFGKAAIRETMTVTILCSDEKFIAKGARTKVANWHELYAPYVKIKEEALPELQEGDAVAIEELLLHQKQTTPPKRYTQSSIITELEKRGLGTKATRADIVENLFKRGYVEGQSITATDLGLKIADALEQALPEIVDEELTRSFEEQLEEIREDKITPNKVLDGAKKHLTTVLVEFKKNEKKLGSILLAAHREYQDEKNTLTQCPKCKQAELKVMFSKKNKSRFVGCSRYPDCDNTYPLPQSGLIVATEKTCPECAAPIISIRAKGKRPQEACINPACPTRKADESLPEEKPCEKCGGMLKLKNGIYGSFYGCSNYPKCRNTQNVKKKEE